MLEKGCGHLLWRPIEFHPNPIFSKPGGFSEDRNQQHCEKFSASSFKDSPPDSQIISPKAILELKTSFLNKIWIIYWYWDPPSKWKCHYLLGPIYPNLKNTIFIHTPRINSISNLNNHRTELKSSGAFKINKGFCLFVLFPPSKVYFSFVSTRLQILGLNLELIILLITDCSKCVCECTKPSTIIQVETITFSHTKKNHGMYFSVTIASLLFNIMEDGE